MKRSLIYLLTNTFFIIACVFKLSPFLSLLFFLLSNKVISKTDHIVLNIQYVIAMEDPLWLSIAREHFLRVKMPDFFL